MFIVNLEMFKDIQPNYYLLIWFRYTDLIQDFTDNDTFVKY